MAKESKSNGSVNSLDEDEILKEICTSNGINYGKISAEGPSCMKLEMFFSGMSRLMCMSRFPNLQTLCIMGQSIKKIEGLGACYKLRELWIAECQVKKIEGLEPLKHLVRLYLYDNQIGKIENLSHLLELEVLWLHTNQITEIDGISGLKHLTDLNLAQNLIEKVGNTLNVLHHLEMLELSGNKVASFKDITYLQKLPHLTSLGLKSPGYAPNPVGLLCNYATHILYHLPGLQILDNIDVGSKNIIEMAESTVAKKKMYYQMKSKTIWRNFSDMEGKLRAVKNQVLTEPYDRIKALSYTLKVLEREQAELEDTEGGESGTESDKDAKEEQASENQVTVTNIEAKKKVIKERIAKWEKKSDEVEVYYTEAVERLRQITDSQVHRMVMELESGANVRFEDGLPSDLWFTSCHDLILSRFCAADYREHGIIGIKIHRITRIHNRILRAKFEEDLTKEVDDEDNYLPLAKSSNYRRLLEYLFWIWDPTVPGGQFEQEKVLEEGFMDPDTYKQIGKPAAVPLTNSISLADRFRIKHSIKQTTGKEYKDICVFRHGRIVISKVFIGKSAQASSHKFIEKQSYPKADTVFRPRKDMDEKSVKLERPGSGIGFADLSGAKTQCECSSRQCEWFVFNHHLALPEYVVDFEYLTKIKPRSPFLSQEEGLKATRDKRPISSMENSSDEDVLNMAPEIKARPRLVTLTEDNLLVISRSPDLSSIRVLNLHGNGLSKLKHLSSLPNLQKLIISFNELLRLDDVAHLNIEYLDASFNKISTLEGLKAMSKLKHLDLTWNKLQNTREDVSILRKHCPILNTLDLRHNNWQKQDGPAIPKRTFKRTRWHKVEGLRLRAIGRIKSLVLLNGEAVVDQESAAALRMAAGSRISQVSLLTHSRTDTVRARTLNLASSAQTLTLYSRNRPDRSGEQDNHWYSKVTTLNLDSQHISKISNLERLENLRYASFNDNDITKIEGLDNCHNLEELSLDHNCIPKIENISKLTRLRRLTMDHNYVSSLENCGVDKLTALRYFSIENNKLRSLAGLQRNTSLIELYVGNNLIENVREIFYLKNLASLVILDLFGNPVSSSTDNYRLFVIYHMKALKALDGTAIESSEGGQAKDTFGGKLTQDFVAERLNHSNFNDVRELDFPQCNVRSVDLGQGELFLNLRSINLEHNNLSSFSGLVFLVNLRVLCLNHNHIECIVPRTKSQITAHAQKQAVRSVYSNNPGPLPPSDFGPDSYTPILENLEVLHLGYNGIKDMSILQLNRLTSLKALFLQGNEITRIEGLEGLQDLRELVLDRNKIKNINDYAFGSQWNLQELHLEENRLKDLSNLGCLDSLQRLFLGMNRIQEMCELEKLEPLMNLVELSVVSNAVARRMLHRPLLVYRMPNLHIIDGIPVNDEERSKAEIYFMEQQSGASQIPYYHPSWPVVNTDILQQQWLHSLFPHSGRQPPQITTTMETTLPGLPGNYKAQIPVKVTNMQLVSGPYIGSNWSGTLQFNEDLINASEIQRGGGRRRDTKSDPPLTQQKSSGSTGAPPSGGKLTGTMTYQHGGANSQVTYGGSNRVQYQFTNVPYVPHQGHTDYDKSSKGSRR